MSKTIKIGIEEHEMAGWAFEAEVDLVAWGALLARARRLGDIRLAGDIIAT